VFRVALVYTLLWYVVVWLQHASEWLTPAGFHPSRDVSSDYGPAFPLLDAVLVWPFAILYLGAGIVAALSHRPGRVRPAIAVLLGCTIYVTGVDPISAFTINRLYIVCLIVLLAAPSAHDGSRVAWPLRVLQLTLVLQYFGAGWCKAFGGDWLQNDDVLWTQIQGVYRTPLAAWLVQVLPRAGWTAMQHAALAFELAAPVLFAVRRLRPLAFVTGLGMHLLIALTMEKLVYFSLQMACFYLLFVDAGRLRTWAGRLRLLPARVV